MLATLYIADLYRGHALNIGTLFAASRSSGITTLWACMGYGCGRWSMVVLCVYAISVLQGGQKDAIPAHVKEEGLGVRICMHGVIGRDV